MITGEFKKIFRNKTFIVITIIVAIINILTILYCHKCIKYLQIFLAAF